MGTYTVIPESTFQDMQLDAGVLLSQFDPANPAVSNEHIITATTGGIQATCQPTFSDLAEDVDNVPNGMMEFQHLDGWECSLSTTALGTSPEMIRMSLGCADIDGTDTTKIVPRADLKQSDFASSIWWVGDKADGGYVAIELKNALSTEGFSLQTTKNGKGQTALTLRGHVSINAQKVVPMLFYSVGADQTTTTVTQTLTHVHSTFVGNSAEIGAPFTAVLTADDGYTLSTPTITMNGSSASSSYSNGFINIASVTGPIVITASATASTP